MGTIIVYERTEQGGKIGFETSDISSMTSKIGVGTYTAISEASDYQLMKLRDKLNKDFPPEKDKHNKFTEPTEKGLYTTQSGVPLYNDGIGSCNWERIGLGISYERWNAWEEIVESFDDSEFPLVHFTSEQLAALAKGE